MILKNSKDSEENLNFSEFVQYMIDHENKLELVFKKIDADNDSMNKLKFYFFF
jgi:hypothetical protein